MHKMAALEAMAKRLGTGDGVATAGEIHPDIPTINDIGHREASRLRTTTEVKHCGYGFFKANTPAGEVQFDGGGMMRRATDGSTGEHVFSWTPIYTGGNVEILRAIGYNIEAVQAALAELIEAEEQAQADLLVFNPGPDNIDTQESAA